jgi:hypothetical protein
MDSSGPVGFHEALKRPAHAIVDADLAMQLLLPDFVSDPGFKEIL